jgi:hypothetical protein
MKNSYNSCRPVLASEGRKQAELRRVILTKILTALETPKHRESPNAKTRQSPRDK